MRVQELSGCLILPVRIIGAKGSEMYSGLFSFGCLNRRCNGTIYLDVSIKLAKIVDFYLISGCCLVEHIEQYLISITRPVCPRTVGDEKLKDSWFCTKPIALQEREGKVMGGCKIKHNARSRLLCNILS